MSVAGRIAHQTLRRLHRRSMGRTRGGPPRLAIVQPEEATPVKTPRRHRAVFLAGVLLLLAVVILRQATVAGADWRVQAGGGLLVALAGALLWALNREAGEVRGGLGDMQADLQRQREWFHAVLVAHTRLFRDANVTAGLKDAVESLHLVEDMGQVSLLTFHHHALTGSPLFTRAVAGGGGDAESPGPDGDLADVAVERLGPYEWYETLQRGEWVMAASEEREQRSHILSAEPEAGPLLFLPIIVAGELWGAFAVVRATNEPGWAEHEVALLAMLAANMGVALQRDAERATLAESEYRYRELVATAPLGVATLDRAGSVVSLNARLVDILGAPGEASLIGQRPLPYLAAVDPGLARDVQRVFAGATLGPTELAASSFTGQPLSVSIHMAPVRSHAGAVVGAQVLVEDITARKEAEAQQQQLQAQLQQAQKMEAVGTLAGGIAHDFNNLLTGILGNLELAMMDAPPDSRSTGHLRVAQEAAEQAAELTRQLLTLGRKNEPTMGPTVLNDTVTSIGRFLRRSLPQNITMHTTLDPELPAIRANAGQLQQALLNLAINARDAMPGGGTLTITTARTEVDAHTARRNPHARPGSFIVFTVADTGEGMPPDVLEHIYEPFFTTKAAGKGTGLGLAMVYTAVHAHDGWITVESTPGHGTVFRLFLPLIPVDTPDPAVESEGPLPTGTERILVVDDTDAVLHLARGILERCGYDVILAWDGQEGLKRYREAEVSFALVVTDLIMPEMGGRDLLAALRRDGETVPVIVDSGYALEGPPEDLIAEGFAAFIPKPFQPATLAHIVRRVLDETAAAAAPHPAESTPSR